MNGTSQSDPVDQATLCPIKSARIEHPDVKVEKTARAAKVNAGEDAVYDITVTAIGDAPSTNVVLTDGGLDAGKVTVGGTDAALCDPITGGTLTCNFGTLDPAGVAGPVSRSITLTHLTTADQCPSISNTATVTADFEETLDNNSAGPVDIEVNCPPDVHVKKSADPTKVTAPGQVTYTITAQNAGPGTADNVTVTDNLDDDLAVKDVTPSQGAGCAAVGAGNTISCNLGSIAESGSATVTIVANVPVAACPKIENQAHVTASNEDPTQTGDNDSDLVNVEVNCPDVHVKKSANPTKVTVPGSLTYTITAQNAGPGTAEHVTVTDNLADRLVVKSVTPSQGAACPAGAGNTISCDLGDIASGGSATVTIVVNVPAGNCTTLTNRAHVTASNEDPTQTDDNDSALISVPLNGCGATRTPGFWQTHQKFTDHIFTAHLGSNINLGWRKVTTKNQLMGMFWASVSYNSNGSRRSTMCQAQIIGSFQLAAAILNTGLENGAPKPLDPVGGGNLITELRAALLAGNTSQSRAVRSEIIRLSGLLDTYNNSGDLVAIKSNDQAIGSADPDTARGKAVITFADCKRR